jgi:hypothetical protein
MADKQSAKRKDRRAGGVRRIGLGFFMGIKRKRRIRIKKIGLLSPALSSSGGEGGKRRWVLG